MRRVGTSVRLGGRRYEPVPGDTIHYFRNFAPVIRGLVLVADAHVIAWEG